MATQIARVLVALLIVPVLIGGVGVEEYGIWLIVQQSVGLLVLADLRATGTLKFTLAVTQHESDLSAKRRQVGAALTFWAMTLPIIAVVTGLAAYALPYVVDVPADLVSTTRVVFLVTMVGVVLDRLLSTPALVLRGMNLDYVGMGIDALMLLVGGVLGLLAVAAGYGLVGYVTGSILGVLAGDAVRGVLARRHLPWLGIERPERSELKQFASHSGWLALGDVSGVLLFGAEIVLVGAVAGATAAAVYGTTQFAVRTVCGPLVELLSSAGPGVARLAGEGHRARALQVRARLVALALGGAVAVGSAVLVANESFVRLWVGHELYGGAGLNALLVTLAVVTTLIRVDAAVVDSFLGFRGRATLTGCGAVVGIAAGAALGTAWGITGVAMGLLLGRLSVLCCMPWLVAHGTRARLAAVVRDVMRPGAATVATLTVAGVLGATVVEPAATWLAFVLLASATAGTAAVAYTLVGVSADARRELVSQLRSAMRKSPRGAPSSGDADVDGVAQWGSEVRHA